MRNILFLSNLTWTSLGLNNGCLIWYLWACKLLGYIWAKDLDAERSLKFFWQVYILKQIIRWPYTYSIRGSKLQNMDGYCICDSYALERLDCWRRLKFFLTKFHIMTALLIILTIMIKLKWIVHQWCLSTTQALVLNPSNML